MQAELERVSPGALYEIVDWGIPPKSCVIQRLAGWGHRTWMCQKIARMAMSRW